ncbi:hypothetical protein V500_03564 [Pseudogymnoascus sp. VKM F-4518 (FW-2643)]|nr:hypothetical protein V500_03564 [Pseudogymnoascus sp. VKM F-4518 (FW-2643)]
MHRNRDPPRHPKRQHHARLSLFSEHTINIRLHGHIRIIAAYTGRVPALQRRWEVGVQERNLPTVHDGGPLDIVVCERHGDRDSNNEVANCGLRCEGASKSAAGNYDSADVTEGDEEEDKVSVDAVEENGFVADDGEELEDHEDAGGDDGDEVEGYPDAVYAVSVPEPFAGDGAGFEGGGGVAADVEVGDAREREAEHGAAEDKDCTLAQGGGLVFVFFCRRCMGPGFEHATLERGVLDYRPAPRHGLSHNSPAIAKYYLYHLSVAFSPQLGYIKSSARHQGKLGYPLTTYKAIEETYNSLPQGDSQAYFNPPHQMRRSPPPLPPLPLHRPHLRRLLPSSSSLLPHIQRPNNPPRYPLRAGLLPPLPPPHNPAPPLPLLIPLLVSARPPSQSAREGDLARCCGVGGFTCGGGGVRGEATLRSHHFPALLHLDSGINLLLELQSPLPAKTATTAYRRTPYTPLQTLHALLTRLDTQATQLLPSRQTRLRPVSVPPPYYETFTSLEEAKGASDELWNYCLYSLQLESQPSSPALYQYHLQPSLSTQQQHPSHADLATLQESYTTALTAFLTTHPPRTPREQQAASILRLHALVAALSLSPASLSAIEDVWEAHTGEFAAIVALARGIMEADNNTVEVGMGRVSMDTGVLGPLYLVALRCRDSAIRREAIALLGRGVRREGLWDSSLLARVAERVVGIEEYSRNAGEGGDRISDVDVVFDPEGCRAGVRFLMEGGGVAVGG